MKNRGVIIPLLVGAGVSGLCSLVVWDKYGDRAALFVACCFLLVNAVYWIAEVARYCEIEGLCVYLMRIRSGDYALDIRDNREGSISKLKNDIYKLTVMLREQAELLRKDKAYLADSLADISHQIKTPLTSMAVMTDLLREPSLPEEKRLEFLNSIRTTIDRMEWLVSTLLKLAKLDAGSIVMKAEPFGVLALCKEAVNPLLIRAELGGVSLSVSGFNAVLSCDRRWTEEAVLNIVKNCIEHTASGGRVRVQCIDNPLHVRVEVTDNGGGIRPEDLPHIFERFYRGKDAKPDSAGIGLAMARAVILHQNGDLTAENTDVGAKFVIRFFKQIV